MNRTAVINATYIHNENNKYFVVSVVHENMLEHYCSIPMQEL
jgi:hypothetical protein